MSRSTIRKRVLWLIAAVIVTVAGVVLVRHVVWWVRAPDARLIGVWKSDYGPMEWGIARLVLTFDATELHTTIEMNTGETLSISAPYTIANGAISSEGIHESQPLRYEIIDGALFLKDDVDGPRSFKRDRLATLMMW